MVLASLRERFRQVMEGKGLEEERVTIRAHPLSPSEAIGRPREGDYPLLRGKERLMEASFKGAKGQAYTDQWGDYEGTLGEVLSLPLEGNFQRAVFIATLNAALASLGCIRGTVHCRDDGPRRCAEELVGYIRENYGAPKVALIGLQPRMAEALSKSFPLRVVDLDPENLGKAFGPSRVEGYEREEEVLRWCDLAVVTGTVLTNGTIEGILPYLDKVLFYGVTIAGPSYLMGWPRFCPFSF